MKNFLKDKADKTKAIKLLIKHNLISEISNDASNENQKLDKSFKVTF